MSKRTERTLARLVKVFVAGLITAAVIEQKKIGVDVSLDAQVTALYSALPQIVITALALAVQKYAAWKD